MRKVLSLLAFSLAALGAHATPYVFTPTDSIAGDSNHADLGDLNHVNAYTWGITATSGGASYANLVAQLNSGYQITGATLTISNLYNWSASDTNNQLFIHLLDNPGKGVSSVVDDPTDNGVNQGVLSDYFSGKISGNQVYGTWVAYGYNAWGDVVPTGATNLYLTQFHDNDGPNSLTQYSFSFSASQLSTLSTYILNGHTGGTGYADFGLGFDPDCHYYNNGVQLTITTSLAAPDTGATAMLLGVACLGLASFRRVRSLSAGADWSATPHVG